MQDNDIEARIRELVDQEHQLREQLATGEISEGEEHQLLQRAEEQLDRCWDLLRQRRARRDAGEDPSQAEARPVDEVESYLQ
jgi:hypothetical protein